MREGFCKTVTAMVIGAASALGVGIPLAVLILFLMMALARGEPLGQALLSAYFALWGLLSYVGLLSYMAEQPRFRGCWRSARPETCAAAAGQRVPRMGCPLWSGLRGSERRMAHLSQRRIL
jgi:hypothetical protein